MPKPLNPYESPTQASEAPLASDEPPDQSWRTRFAVSMWVCGVAAVMTLPVYPWDPTLWAARDIRSDIHWAWLSPFCCGIASVVTAIGLFRLGKVADMIGATAAILFVGWWPVALSVNWWYYFATR